MGIETRGKNELITITPSGEPDREIHVSSLLRSIKCTALRSVKIA